MLTTSGQSSAPSSPGRSSLNASPTRKVLARRSSLSLEEKRRILMSAIPDDVEASPRSSLTSSDGAPALSPPSISEDEESPRVVSPHNRRNSSPSSMQSAGSFSTPRTKFGQGSVSASTKLDPSILVPSPDADPEQLARTQGQAIEELIKTERVYVGQLEHLVSHFLEPVRARHLLTPSDVSKVFSNVELLLGFNRKVLRDLDVPLEEDETMDMRIAEVFCKAAAFFRMYTQFVNATDDMAIHVQVCEEQYPAFATLVASEKVADPARLSLDDYLVKPVQRVCRYPLIFEAILKNTRRESPSREQLEEVWKRMHAIVSDLNEQKRRAEILQEERESMSRGSEFGGSADRVPRDDQLRSGLLNRVVRSRSGSAAQGKHAAAAANSQGMQKLCKVRVFDKNGADVRKMISVEPSDTVADLMSQVVEKFYNVTNWKDYSLFLCEKGGDERRLLEAERVYFLTGTECTEFAARYCAPLEYSLLPPKKAKKLKCDRCRGPAHVDVTHLDGMKGTACNDCLAIMLEEAEFKRATR